jgi:lipopolysaccharide export system protein LptA
LVGIRIVGLSEIRTYGGHVSFSQGNVNIKCDVAKHDVMMNEIELLGNVVITQEEMTLSSPKVFYDGNTGVANADNGVVINDANALLIAPRGTYSTKTVTAEFTGEVTIDDDSTRIYAETIKYNRKTRNSNAYGNVYIEGKYTPVVLTADVIDNYPIMKYTKAYGKPVLFQIDSTVRRFDSRSDETNMPDDSIEVKYDTLSIACDTMESFRDIANERYIFKYNIEIFKGKVAAKANSGIYNRSSGMISLTEKPIIWYDSTQLFSDSTVIYLDSNKIKTILAKQNAFAGMKDDSIKNDRLNQLSGEEIGIYFSADSINYISGLGNAKSLYFLTGDEGSNGTSRNSADTININFEEGKPAFIKWTGGVQGEFFPEELVTNPKDYYLPNYKWEELKPHKKVLYRRETYKR